MRQYLIDKYDKGVINNINADNVDGAASDSLNWLTKGDKIELRRGYKVIGTELSGTGKVTGLHIARKADGTAQPFYTYGKKIKYYDSGTADWIEIGSDQLGTAADGEDISFTSYTSLAGYQTLLNSPNSSYYKIMNANPGSITNVYNSSKTFKGYIKARNGRALLWNRTNDKVNMYGSWIDAQDSTVYTTVTGENIGTGDGATKTFTGTLTFKAGNARRTCFAISVTDTVETFTDNRNGVLTGSAGGTGTINYTTGAISVTFNTAPLNLQAITVDYQHEDISVKGLADFTSSATRVAGEGFTLLQGDGGKLQTIEIYKDIWYCLHERNTWFISLPANDLGPTNRIFREKAGINNWRAAIATGDGIYYIDDSDKSAPRFRLLTFDSSSTEVIPVAISYNVDLSGYVFDSAMAFDWGEYVLFAFKSSSSAIVNDRMMAYHKIWKSIDILDYSITCAADKDGLLWVGDSISNNVMELFSGFDDNNTIINNYWTGVLTQLKVDQIKKVKRLTIEGEISRDQSLNVYVSYDRGTFTLLGTVEGDGSYVDASNPHTVGSTMVGSSEVGGGGDGIEVFHYAREFKIRSDKFDNLKIKFEATNIGYVSVEKQDFYDIQTYGQKNIQRYRS